jgi:hypothetical protein
MSDFNANDDEDAPWLQVAVAGNAASSDTARRGANVADSDKEIDNATLRNMARQTLATLIDDMQQNPSAFKPNEIIAAIREALDRTEGKAAQTLNVESKATVTHEHIMSIAPADAYRMLLDGGTIVDLAASQPALPHHTRPNLNGGDMRKSGGGVYVLASTPTN